MPQTFTKLGVALGKWSSQNCWMSGSSSSTSSGLHGVTWSQAQPARASHEPTSRHAWSSAIIAERLSARLLIVQCSQVAFVCIYIYIRHTLIAWAWFLWSRPQTTKHVVLVRPEGDRKIVRVREPKWSRVRPGGDRRVKKIVGEPKWSRSSPSVIVLESEDGNKGTLHQKRVRQRRKESDRYSHDTLLTFWLFRPPLCHLHHYISSPAPRTSMLHVVTTCIFPDISSAQRILCTCVFLVVITMHLTISLD